MINGLTQILHGPGEQGLEGVEAVALGVEALLQRVPQVLLVVHQQLRGGRGVLFHDTRF